MSDQENILVKDKHILICPDGDFDNLNGTFRDELDYIKRHFCGVVHVDLEETTYPPDSIIYLCGNIELSYNRIPTDHTINIVLELSYNYTGEHNIVHIGEVPINIHGVGVYFRRLFNGDKNYFDEINTSHKFQSLKEGNKPDVAYRTGIYLTDITQIDDEIELNLLRCSTNLDGPTDNFRDIDHEIIDKVNRVGTSMFDSPVTFNHVLAQIYENSIVEKNQGRVERKAIIKAHSDKTKDMPRNALIAFTTFYDTSNISPKHFSNNLFDICYTSKSSHHNSIVTGLSALTRLRFSLKKDAYYTNPHLVREFDVTLYPNSVFIIPLSTNRLYTHAIKPSALPVSKLFRRLGYIIRCSDTKAVFKNNQTYIKNPVTRELEKLQDITNDDVRKIRELYLTENITTQRPDYNDIYFSMNSGDYKKPIV